MAERLTKEMRDFVPILEKNGYIKVRCKGSHFIYVNTATHKSMTVNKDLKRVVKRKLIKQYNLEI